MQKFRFLALAVIAGLCFMATSHKAEAQVSISIGPPPVCPYGYFSVPPYACAPYGYYGPEWFSGGIFIGAGPWFHGPAHFHGYVDNHYHPDHGYHGPMPARGEAPRHGWNGHPENFHGNEARDGHGHVVHEEHGGH